MMVTNSNFIPSTASAPAFNMGTPYQQNVVVNQGYSNTNQMPGPYVYQHPPGTANQQVIHVMPGQMINPAATTHHRMMPATMAF